MDGTQQKDIMMTDDEKAQKIANKAYRNVLLAIRQVERLEKVACSRSDNDAAVVAGELLICLRQAKNIGMKADGVMGISVKSGGT